MRPSSKLASLCLAGLIALPQLALAESRPAPANHDHHHDHAHGEAHDHAHGHSHAAPLDAEAAALAKRINSGFFYNSEVADRPLSDWAGGWQSVYPLLVSGKLDAVMAAKAAKGTHTEAEYRAEYETGYRTDIAAIKIMADAAGGPGGTFTFTRDDGQVLQADYAADGHEVLTYARGNRGVRFLFRRIAGDEAAPLHVQFSDHRIAPSPSDHFHIYMGDDRAALLENVTNWPTYYPSALSEDQILEEMLAH